MQKKSPLQLVRERFNSKEELVAQLSRVLEVREGESTDDLAARLRHVPNSKLLHLHQLQEKVQALGGRAELVSKVAALKGQSKDRDYTRKLSTLSLGQLVDMHTSLTRKKN